MKPQFAALAAACRTESGKQGGELAAAPIGRQANPPLATHRQTACRQLAARQPGNQTWLTDRAEQSRRKARPEPCPTCRTDTLTGPDHDNVAHTPRVDTNPTDRLTEIAALLAGRHSYDLIRGELHHRDPEHHHSPNRPHPVLLTHTCTTNTKEALF